MFGIKYKSFNKLCNISPVFTIAMMQLMFYVCLQMMKKRIFILSFIALFVVSTTGLPITYHLCKAMKSVSLQACGMCNNKSSDCCKAENYENKILVNENEFCCNTKFVANPLTEEYISISSDIQKIDLKIFVFTISSENLFSLNVTKNSYVLDNSPPRTYSNSLYLNNSVLLI